MTPRTITNETLFSLVFGTEAVILFEIGLLTIRAECSDKSSNVK